MKMVLVKESKLNSNGKVKPLLLMVKSFFFRCVMQMVLVSSNEMLWVVFSGASFHVIPHRSFFTSYESWDSGLVKMGNSNVSKMVVKGVVCIVTYVVHSLVLKDVRHIQYRRWNRISDSDEFLRL